MINLALLAESVGQVQGCISELSCGNQLKQIKATHCGPYPIKLGLGSIYAELLRQPIAGLVPAQQVIKTHKVIKWHSTYLYRGIEAEDILQRHIGGNNIPMTKHTA